jgi:hypothetical protein
MAYLLHQDIKRIGREMNDRVVAYFLTMVYNIEQVSESKGKHLIYHSKQFGILRSE